MGGVRRVREGWESPEAERMRLLRQMTVQERWEQYLALQQALESPASLWNLQS
ncbi:MAG: hypothetical protein ACUVXE_01920 [Anaerolineae bacterium]